MDYRPISSYTTEAQVRNCAVASVHYLQHSRHRTLQRCRRRSVVYDLRL